MKLLLLWLALSIKSPNDTAIKVFDYEISTGSELHYKVLKSDIKLLWERENGKYYYGHSGNIDMRYLGLSDYTSSAKNISKQTGFIKYPKTWKGITVETGVGCVLDSLRFKSMAFYSKVQTSFFSIESAGLKELNYFKAKVNYKYFLNSRVYIEPMGIYFCDQKRSDYQGKIKVGYKWNSKS